MERLVLLLISLLLACEPIETSSDVVFNRANVSVKTAKGICYVNGQPFSGTLLETATTGDTLSIEIYRDGKEHGQWKQFYSKGSSKATRYFVDGKKQNEYYEWWPNASLKLAYQFKADEYDGILKEWDINGQLIKESSYREGHEEGTQKAWYSNGKVRSNYVVYNGRRYGLLGTKNCVNVADSIFAQR